MSVRHLARAPAPAADVLIVGAGACGLTAALAAADAGASVVVVERDKVPAGSTALSAGLVPAAGTAAQARAGIQDSAEALAADIRRKSHGKANETLVRAASEAAGPAITWLGERHGLPFELVDGFVYPGHGVRRMHAMPERSGAALVDRLRQAAEEADITILTGAKVETLSMARGRAVGAVLARPDGEEAIGAGAVVLACNGYGGNKAAVARHIPALAQALWFGHDGNDGSALAWGEALGADLADLSGHQGHGSVAHPHGILITWATMTAGGFQVDCTGARFSDESEGYSEQAARVLARPGGVAYSIFDERIAAIARQFEDFRRAEAAGAVLHGDTGGALAAALGLEHAAAFRATLEEARDLAGAGGRDRFGRVWESPPLAPPFYGVCVTGALFHTQGGLVTDAAARVLKAGRPIPGLFAAGGAAVGVSGPDAAGYLSGNGLLTAIAMGRVAGMAAAGALSNSPCVG